MPDPIRVLVTGGAGFIGRWVVGELLGRGEEVVVLDNLSSGSLANLAEWDGHPRLTVVTGDIRDRRLLADLFREGPAARGGRGFHTCHHLAASINVQDSIDRPRETFENDVAGTFNLLEECQRQKTRMVFVSTCMVYAPCTDGAGGPEVCGISESHPTLPASPYAASKLAAEELCLSYHHAYGLPVAVLRPFNTYGPYQRADGEGGAVAIFIKRALAGEELLIYGDGTQTRDLMYATDCARFIVEAGRCEKALRGFTINAGTGSDISVNDLAHRITGQISCITGNRPRSQHVDHIHPRSEIQKLLCESSLARRLLGWRPEVSLDDGIARTREWILRIKGF